MIAVRKADERGHANHGWLDTWHTFSFADYYDPEHMGFGVLRVINEDFVEPGKGFATHGHRDMEIITYVLEGQLAHKDSMGNGSIIRPGEVQRMSAGTGITHSEFNASDREPVHLLQIWILPKFTGIRPGYEQKVFSAEEKRGKLRLVASPDGREGSVTINQDAFVYATVLDAGASVTHRPAPGRKAYVHVARGAVNLNGIELASGDGSGMDDERTLRLSADTPSEVLLFDLP